MEHIYYIVSAWHMIAHINACYGPEAQVDQESGSFAFLSKSFIEHDVLSATVQVSEA